MKDVYDHFLRRIKRRLSGPMSENILKLFSSELKVINIGLELFKDALGGSGPQRGPSLMAETTKTRERVRGHTIENTADKLYTDSTGEAMLEAIQRENLARLRVIEVASPFRITDLGKGNSRFFISRLRFANHIPLPETPSTPRTKIWKPRFEYSSI